MLASCSKLVNDSVVLGKLLDDVVEWTAASILGSDASTCHCGILTKACRSVLKSCVIVGA